MEKKKIETGKVKKIQKYSADKPKPSKPRASTQKPPASKKK